MKSRAFILIPILCFFVKCSNKVENLEYSLTNNQNVKWELFISDKKSQLFEKTNVFFTFHNKTWAQYRLSKDELYSFEKSYYHDEIWTDENYSIHYKKETIFLKFKDYELKFLKESIEKDTLFFTDTNRGKLIFVKSNGSE